MSPEADSRPPDESGTDPARGAEEEHPAGPLPWREVAEGGEVDVGGEEPPAP